jgi:pimeloyl-ACP methyl ester carboxylesterase
MHELNKIEVQVNSVDFVCLTQGHGPLVLLVHGFPDIPQTWASQMQALADAGYQVVAPYLPGYLP